MTTTWEQIDEGVWQNGSLQIVAEEGDQFMLVEHDKETGTGTGLESYPSFDAAVKGAQEDWNHKQDDVAECDSLDRYDFFIEAFNTIAGECHETAIDKGFWDADPVIAQAFAECCKRLGIGTVDMNAGAQQVVIDIMGTYGIGGGPTTLDKAALIVSEIGEFIEASRKKEPEQDKHCPEFRNDEVELADAIIRIMDLGRARGYRVAEAIVAKMRANAKRPHMHGKTI